MINAATITRAMETLLRADATVGGYTIERGEYVNMDMDRVPWVGIYRGDMVYDVQTLGRGANNWKAEFPIKVIVQSATSKGNANDAEDDLEEYIRAVLDAVVLDKTIGGTVAMVTGITIEYSFNETESETVYFQNAEISILTEVRTS